MREKKIMYVKVNKIIPKKKKRDKKNGRHGEFSLWNEYSMLNSKEVELQNNRKIECLT